MSSSLRRRLNQECETRPTYNSVVPGSFDQADNDLNSGDLFFDITDMTCRDRTLEFNAAVKSLQGRQMNGYAPSIAVPRKIRDVQEWKEFMRIAKNIGKELQQTYSKLEKLTVLAKRKSLFDDKPMEIQELTYIIKQDINGLNKDIAQLQQLVKMRNVQKGKHMQSHSQSVLVSLQSKLAVMSNDFRQVLEVRTENLKRQRNRQEQFGDSAVPSGLPPAAMSEASRGVVLLNPNAQHNGRYGETSISMDDLQQSQQRQNQQQMMLIDEQDTYLQSRSEAMHTIESTIVELGGIFQQLATMVKEQGETIQRIDHNIEDTQLNVEAAHTEILKYFQSVTSNRWLIIKVFAVLIIFFIIFVVFMA